MTKVMKKKSDAIFEKKTDSCFQKWHKSGIGEFHSIKARNSSTKNLHFDGLLLSKVYNASLQVEILRGVMCVLIRVKLSKFLEKTCYIIWKLFI